MGRLSILLILACAMATGVYTVNAQPSYRNDPAYKAAQMEQNPYQFDHHGKDHIIAEVGYQYGWDAADALEQIAADHDKHWYVTRGGAVLSILAGVIGVVYYHHYYAPIWDTEMYDNYLRPAALHAFEDVKSVASGLKDLGCKPFEHLGNSS